MKIKTKIFLAFLTPNLLYVFGMIWMIYYFTSLETLLSLPVLLLLIGGTLFITAIFLVVVKNLALMFEIPLEHIDEALEKALQSDYSYKFSGKFSGEIGQVSKKLDQLLAKIRMENLAETKQIQSAAKQIKELEQKLAVDEEAMLKVLKEIDKEKELSKKQAQELKKFALAVEETSDHICITDAEGLTLYSNKAGEQITGYTMEEAKGKKAGTLWGGQMDAEFYAEMWHKIKIDKEVYRGELNNKRKNGENYIAELTISPIVDESGKVIFFVAVERDITKAKDVDRMKTEFISLASHQLRTPLSAIRWGLETLLRDETGPLNEKQKKYSTDIYKSTEKALDVVEGLLNISRIETGRIVVDPQEINFKDLLAEIKKELEPQYTTNKQTLEISIDESVPNVVSDPNLLRHAYINLLTNAMKYSSHGSQISVKITSDERYVTSEIKDHGYGIPKEDHGRIFQKFFRSQNISAVETSGTGLGLYLVGQIIETLNGEIWFESEEGVGTTFWFKIPVKDLKAREGDVKLED